jgi:hypothetical protein
VGAGDLPYTAAAAAAVAVAGSGCRLVGHRVRLGGCRHHPRLLAEQHPHLVHEIAVLADQRRRAGHAFTSDALEEWHRYSLPAFTERMKTRLRNHCEDGHQAWPAKGRHTRHTADTVRRTREEHYARDVGSLRPAEAWSRQRPRLGLVNLDTGEINDL